VDEFEPTSHADMRRGTAFLVGVCLSRTLLWTDWRKYTSWSLAQARHAWAVRDLLTTEKRCQALAEEFACGAWGA
jgi:hypothetical protein